MSDPQPAHSTLGASVFKRVKACPASRRASLGMPNEASQFAAQGTVAHGLGEQALRDWDGGYYWYERMAARIGEVVKQEGFDITIDAEMVRHVKGYVEFVLSKFEIGDTLMVETRFDLSKIHPGVFGTSDAGVYSPRRKSLVTIDLKYGAGVGVDAVENEQGLFYALGALLQIPGGVQDCEIVIYQPRAPFGEPVKSWRFTADRLFDFMAELKQVALATERPDAPFKVGEHCQFCPASPLCDTLTAFREDTIKLMETIMAQANVAVPDYDREAAAALMRRIPIIESALKRYREFMTSETKQGRGPLDWKIVEGRGTRNWANPEATKAWLQLNGYDEAEILTPPVPPALKSVAQIEDVVSKDDAKALASHIVKVPGSPALAPPEDKRKAIPVITAAQAFMPVPQ